MEGVAWENDKVGFRNYMDQRNGMDIFGKLTQENGPGQCGNQPAVPATMNRIAWGMDILKVGTSLGAGGIGYMYNDSIYRVGDTGSGSLPAWFSREVSEADSIFPLITGAWTEMKSNVIQQIEISAGKHYYQSSVSFSGSDLEYGPGGRNRQYEE